MTGCLVVIGRPEIAVQYPFSIGRVWLSTFCDLALYCCFFHCPFSALAFSWFLALPSTQSRSLANKSPMSNVCVLSFWPILQADLLVDLTFGILAQSVSLPCNLSFKFSVLILDARHENISALSLRQSEYIYIRGGQSSAKRSIHGSIQDSIQVSIRHRESTILMNRRESILDESTRTSILHQFLVENRHLNQGASGI